MGCQMPLSTMAKGVSLTMAKISSRDTNVAVIILAAQNRRLRRDNR